MRNWIKRIVLKLSGEMFSSGWENLEKTVEEIKAINDIGIEAGIVVGGGNFIRGAKTNYIDRISADNVGMIGTIANAIILEGLLNKKGIKTLLDSSITIPSIVKKHTHKEIFQALSSNNFVIFAGGTGNPYFTTDTAAALKAIEIKANLLLKATNVEGVYDSDPKQVLHARMFERLSYEEALEKKIKVMDLTAISLCMEHQLPIVVFNIYKEGNIKRVLMGEKVGTKIE